jgi:hypothetical protein
MGGRTSLGTETQGGYNGRKMLLIQTWMRASAMYTTVDIFTQNTSCRTATLLEIPNTMRLKTKRE